MYLHHTGVYRITLILAIVAITCQISWASTQCKTAVMDVHMKRCRLGADRVKRDLEKFDLLKHDDTLKYDEESKKQEGPDYSKENDRSSHSTPQKRQILGGVTDVIQPMMHVVDSATQSKTITTGLQTFDPTDLGPIATWPSRLPSILHLLRTLHLVRKLETFPVIGKRFLIHQDLTPKAAPIVFSLFKGIK